MCDHDARFDKIDAALKELNDRLFVGDGTPALATRVDRAERFAKTVVWWLTPLYVMILSVAGKMIYDVLKS